jgi:hypothetical protein
MTNDEGNPNDEIRIGPACLAQDFVIRASSLIRHSSFELHHLIYPFTFPIGVNRATGLLMPANSVAAITSSMSL